MPRRAMRASCCSRAGPRGRTAAETRRESRKPPPLRSRKPIQVVSTVATSDSGTPTREGTRDAQKRPTAARRGAPCPPPRPAPGGGGGRGGGGGGGGAPPPP